MTRGSAWGCCTIFRSALVNVMFPSLNIVCLGFLAVDWSERTSFICLIIQISPWILFSRSGWFEPPIMWIMPRGRSSSSMVLSVSLSPRSNLELGLTLSFSSWVFSLLMNSFKCLSWTSYARKTFRARQFSLLCPFFSLKEHLHCWLCFLGSPPVGLGFLKLGLSRMQARSL